MKRILGKKMNMVQFFTPEGKAIPATLVDAGPVTVVTVRTKDKDGYTALQLGYGTQKKERVSKAVLGHLKDMGPFEVLKEFRVTDEEASTTSVGAKTDVSAFAEGDIVSVAGISKSKGFQGVVKRHGFGGGPRTHGQKHSEREPGSIGGGLRTRVPKGMRMAGRMGGDRITVEELSVLAIDAENNQILIKGALPGRRGTLLEIVG